MEIYNDGEFAAIRTTLSSGVLTKRDTAVYRLIMETGIRGIDVCSLELKDIDWERTASPSSRARQRKRLSFL